MADAAAHAHDHEHKVGFFTRWFCSTNHKDIGTLYLITSALMGFIAVAFTVIMRMELMEPGVQYLTMEDGTPNGHMWNVLVTGHGILMMFFVIIPALFGGFGNYLHAAADRRAGHGVPADEQPVSYWLYVAGCTMALLSVIVPGGNGQTGSGIGWVLYAPAYPPLNRAYPPTSRSSRSTSRVPRRSWARST